MQYKLNKKILIWSGVLVVGVLGFLGMAGLVLAQSHLV